MSGSGLPAGGFRWVEPPEAPGPPQGFRSRWWWAGAVVLVVVLAGGVLVWRLGPGGLGGGDAGGAKEPPIGTPRDLLVGFSLNRQPVAGWRIRPTDVGLPPRANVGELFATSGDKAYLRAEFHDYFCTKSCVPNEGWVYGLDTRTGARLFAPLALPGYRYGVECYGNGPAVAVCVTYDKPLTAWVVNLDHGVVSFTGPTDLYPQHHGGLGEPEVQPVGTFRGQSRLVAVVEGQGVYGVGPHAERTWFIPGSGFVFPTDDLVADDIPAPTMGVSRAPEYGTMAPPGSISGGWDRVFSVVDGADMTPTAPAGTMIDQATVYTGGFAYRYKETGAESWGVLFYDDSARLVAREPLGNAMPKLLDNAAMPTVEGQSDWQVYTADGRLVLEIPSPGIGPGPRMVGTKLYIPQDYREGFWQQWDLLTGQPAPRCGVGRGDITYTYLDHTDPVGNYVGSDGTILLTISNVPRRQIRATDMATCQTLWQTVAHDDLHAWKVGTGLIEYDYHRNTLTWLRPPP